MIQITHFYCGVWRLTLGGGIRTYEASRSICPPDTLCSECESWKFEPHHVLWRDQCGDVLTTKESWCYDPPELKDAKFSPGIVYDERFDAFQGGAVSVVLPEIYLLALDVAFRDKQ